MLRIGKLPDYGLLISTVLADAEGLMTTDQITRQTSLPLATARKPLKLLVDTGLVTSHRGSKGGYELAQSSENVSIAEVIEAIDGPIALTECIQRRNNYCPLKNSCRMKGQWCALNGQIVDLLQSVSISELTSSG